MSSRIKSTSGAALVSSLAVLALSTCSDERSPSAPTHDYEATGKLAVHAAATSDADSFFTVHLPGIDGAAADDITVPNHRPVYAIFVTGYSANPAFNYIYWYRFAEYLQREWNAYVHWSWWNNLLAPYMERPLHDPMSVPATPGRFRDEFPYEAFIPLPLLDGTYADKAVPDEDFQFQSDAKRFLRAIRAHNPCAMIVLVGHSMGGASVVRLGQETGDVLIDIVAPIDPVESRGLPVGRFIDLNDPDFTPYNWTRSRITHEDFLGYKQADCAHRTLGVCDCLASPPCEYGVDCIGVGSWRDLPPELGLYLPSLALAACPVEITHRPPTRVFGPNVVNLYYPWQEGFLPPFDYFIVHKFTHDAPPGGQTFQGAIVGADHTSIYGGQTTTGMSQMGSPEDRRTTIMSIGQDGAPTPDDPDACPVSPGMIALFELMNKPPQADAGPDQQLDCSGPEGTEVILDGSNSVDSDRDDLSYVWFGPFGTATGETATVTVPIGIHNITLRVSDPTGHVCEDEVVVAIMDPPPELTVTLSPEYIWPPNHKMVGVEATVEATDVCGEVVSVVLVSITSNEPDDDMGDGHTSEDISEADYLTLDTSFKLRAERSGYREGRVYTVTYRATDDAGNVTETSAEVLVQRDRS